MTYDRLPSFVRATPEYVLDVIRDSHRQQCQYDPVADPDIELTFDTTVAAWREACDLLGWRRLGRALDAEWQLERSDSAWDRVLEPAGQRSLREVCEFIASGASRPSVEPVTILGTTCLPAGAFLAIRSVLGRAGANVDRVSPSTPLTQYTRRYLGVFLGPISRLAPNALPAVRISTPWYDLSIMGFGCSLYLVVAAAIGGFLLGLLTNFRNGFVSPLAAAAGAIVILTSWTSVWIAARYVGPSKVEFGSLRTFRDLAKVVADGAQFGGRHG
jgi:hypothetical protein